MWKPLHVKCPLFVSGFNETWNFLTYFPEKLKYQVSWKFVQWNPSYFMRTNGQTDMVKLILAFRNSAKAPKLGVFGQYCPNPASLRETHQTNTMWFKYGRGKLWLVYTQISPGHIWTTLYNSGFYEPQTRLLITMSWFTTSVLQFYIL
jgi:hypothetical protein